MALDYTILSPKDFKKIPWRNGQGMTTELKIGQAEGGMTFNWRLSSAPVDSNGPFSDFSGYDRILVLLKGNGMDLFHGNGCTAHLRKPYDMAVFSGDLKTHAVLVDGGIQDFNIMTRQGHCRANVDLFKSFGEHSLSIAADDFLVYSPDHDTCLGPQGEGAVCLPAGHLFHVKSVPMSPWYFQGHGIICIQVRNRTTCPPK